MDQAMTPEAPDIRTVAPDLVVPGLSAGEPAPGRRVSETLPGWPATDVYHVLYLPADWAPGQTRKWPVIVEYAGNGDYASAFDGPIGGRPEDSSLGYGISAGAGFLWLGLPFLDDAGAANVTTWWGTPPGYDPRPTVAYALAAVPAICARFGGDPARVLFAGFSRGSIAGYAIGLHDDAIAALWRAFVLDSRHEGVFPWLYPGSTGDAALARLRRLGPRPQFVCRENDGGLAATRAYLESTGLARDVTYAETGFRNHSDAWILRPSPTRAALRTWVRRVMA